MMKNVLMVEDEAKLIQGKATGKQIKTSELFNYDGRAHKPSLDPSHFSQTNIYERAFGKLPS